jgi:hypothetical protein
MTVETKWKISMSMSRKHSSMGHQSCSTKSGIHGKYSNKSTGCVELYDSMYELLYMEFLDSDKDVTTWTKKHKIVVNYNIDGKEHNYVPDFLVKFKSGEQRVVEVKGVQDISVAFKEQALHFFCAMNSVQVETLFFDDINSMCKKLHNRTFKTWKKLRLESVQNEKHKGLQTLPT